MKHFIDLSNFPDQDIEKVGKEIRETVLNGLVFQQV